MAVLLILFLFSSICFQNSDDLFLQDFVACEIEVGKEYYDSQNFYEDVIFLKVINGSDNYSVDTLISHRGNKGLKELLLNTIPCVNDKAQLSKVDSIDLVVQFSNISTPLESLDKELEDFKVNHNIEKSAYFLRVSYGVSCIKTSR